MAEAREPEVVQIEIEQPVIVDWTEENIIQAIRKTFPEDADTAVAVAKAESGLNTHAINPEAHKGCSSSRGLFQIACVNYNGDLEELYDVETNLEVARMIYERSGWQEWGVCHNGDVDCDL